MSPRTWIVVAALAFAPRVARADEPKPYPVPVTDPKPYPVPVAPDPTPHPEPVNPDTPKPPEPKPPDKGPDGKQPDPKPDGKQPEQRPDPNAPPPKNPPPPTNPPPKNPPPPTNPSPKPPSNTPPKPVPTTPEPPPPVEPPKVEPPKEDDKSKWISGEPMNLRGGEKIAEIVVHENTKTTADTVELIARIGKGDDWSFAVAERVKHDLVSSGLFKDVDVLWDKAPNTENGVRVHLKVHDKHSWVVAPAFYNQPTNTGGGVGYGENNLFGLNQKLLIYAQVATGDSFFVGAWQIPNINGTRFSAQVDTYFANSRNIEYSVPLSYLETPHAARESRLLYLNGGLKLGIELFRGFHFDSRLRAAHVSYKDVHLAENATMMDVTTDPLADTVPKPGAEGWDISNEFDLSIDRRANWYGVSTGYRYGISYEHSIAGDFHYQELGLGLYRAYQVLERHNLVLKGNLQIGQHMPFQQEYLMGGTTMRGWLNNQFRGDLKALVNVEYSLPLFTMFGLSVRGLGFLDSGYTEFRSADNPERNYLPNSAYSEHSVFAPFKNSVGVGTRLYLRQIVLPLLGLDVGYGLEARDVQVYLAIGLTD